MLQLLITSHGDFCEEIVRSAQIIVGDITEVETLSLHSGCDLGEYKSQVKQLIETLTKKGELLVLTDIMYGTPFNSVCELMDQYKFQHISGINMPVFLEIAVSRKFNDLKEVIDAVSIMAPSSIIHVNKLLEEEEEK